MDTLRIVACVIPHVFQGMRTEVTVTASSVVRPDDHAQRNADAQTREDGAEEDILSQHPTVQQPLKQPQKGVVSVDDVIA